VATVSAIYGIGKPEDYTQMRLIMRVGDKTGQRDLIARLITMQYTRNEIDFGRGTSACAATPSTSSRPSTPSWRCGWSCSTTRSSRSRCWTR
jgi:hypothetical protein